VPKITTNAFISFLSEQVFASRQWLPRSTVYTGFPATRPQSREGDKNPGAAARNSAACDQGNAKGLQDLVAPPPTGRAAQGCAQRSTDHDR